MKRLVEKMVLPYYGELYVACADEATVESIVQLQEALKKLYEYESKDCDKISPAVNSSKECFDRISDDNQYDKSIPVINISKECFDRVSDDKQYEVYLEMTRANMKLLHNTFEVRESILFADEVKKSNLSVILMGYPCHLLLSVSLR